MCAREVGGRGFDGHAGFSARERLEPGHVVRVVPLQPWCSHPFGDGGDRGEPHDRLRRESLETSGCHANHCVDLRTQVQLCAQRVASTTEFRLPVPVRQHDYVGGRFGHIVFSSEESPDDRFHIEHLPQVRFARSDLHDLRRIADTNGDPSRVERHHGIERRGVFLEVEEPPVADVRVDVLLLVPRVDEIDAAGAIWRDQEARSSEEQTVDDPEHRRIGADAESERRDDGEGKPGLETHPAQRISQILHERTPPLRATLLVGASTVDRCEPLARALDIAEPPLCFILCFLGGHSLFHELPHRHVEVKAQLVVNRAVDASATERESQQTPNSRRPIHQSACSDTLGSARAARRAGIQLAASATAINVATTASSTRGSFGETWNRRGAIHLPDASAIKAPSITPGITTRSPSRTTRPITSSARAPSATRTLISCARCATLYASTLYRPTAASTSASPPNTVNIVAPKRHDRVLPPISVDIDVTVRYDAPGIAFCSA